MPVISYGRRAYGTRPYPGFGRPPAPIVTITNPATAVTTGGPSFTVSWTLVEPDGVPQYSYRVVVTNAAGTTTYYDSGTLTGTTASVSINAQTQGMATDTTGGAYVCTVYSYPSADSTVFGYKTKTFDLQFGVVTATITSPANQAVTSASQLSPTWTFSDSRANTQQAYRLRLWGQQNGVLFYDSGFVASTATTATIPYYLVDNSAYTLGLTLKNVNGVSSTETTVNFSVDQSTPTQYQVEKRVGQLYEVGINGVGYMLAEDPTGQDYKYRRVTVPLELTRFNTGSTNFGEAIEHYIYSAFYSFELGTGQQFQDRPTSAQDRFWDSDGVFGFVPNQLTLLPTTAKTITSTATSCKAVVAGGTCYVMTGAAGLSYTTTLGGTGTALTLPSNIVDLTTDGQSWYAAMANGAIQKGTTTAGAAFSTPGTASQIPTGATAQLVAWQAQRLCVAYINSAGQWVFSTLNSQGNEEVANGRLILPAGFQITGITGGGGFVWISAYSGNKGVIYKWDLSANPPSQALDLPTGTVPTTIFYYLSNVMIRGSYTLGSGNTGGRIYRCAVDTNGNLTATLVGELTHSTLNNGNGFFGAKDRYVYFSWEGMDGTNTGVGALDLSLGGYAKNLKSTVTTDNYVGAAFDFLGQLCFTVGNSGLWVAQSTFRTSGWIQTSISDRGSALQKVYEQVTVLLGSPLNSGESINVSYSLDGGASFTTLPAATLNSAGQKYVVATLGRKSNSITLKVTLNGPGNTTPNLQVVSVRQRLTGVADTELQVPINCMDQVRGLDDRDLPENSPGAGARRARLLESLAQTRVSFQDIDWSVTNNIDTYDVSNVEVRSVTVYDKQTGRANNGQVAILTLRKVAK